MKEAQGITEDELRFLFSRQTFTALDLEETKGVKRDVAAVVAEICHTGGRPELEKEMLSKSANFWEYAANNNKSQSSRSAKNNLYFSQDRS